MSPGHPDRALVERHLYALEAAVLQLRRHAGKPLEALQDLDEAWAVQRGLQLCAQNALDVATHLLAGAGRDAPDYASALDGLGALGVLSPAFLARFRGLATRNRRGPKLHRCRLHHGPTPLSGGGTASGGNSG